MPWAGFTVFDMTQAPALSVDWEAQGKSLAQARIETDWRLADSLALAKQEGQLPPGRLDELSKTLGIAKPRLRDAAKAATRFPPNLRVAALSFEHHAALASLPDDEALPLLNRALEEGLSVSAMRQHVTQRRYALGENFADDDVDSTLCTLIVRAWNRATPGAREMALDHFKIAEAHGLSIVDEDETAYA